MQTLTLQSNLIQSKDTKKIVLSLTEGELCQMLEDDFTVQLSSPNGYIVALQYNGFLTCTTPIITWEKSLYLHETEEIVLDFLAQQINKIRSGTNALEFIVKAKSFMAYYEFDYVRNEYNLFTEYNYVFDDKLPLITPAFNIEQTEIVYIENEIDFKVNFHCSFGYSSMRIEFIVNYYSPAALVKQILPNHYLHACILSNQLAIEQAKQLIVDTFTHFRANSWEELLLKTATFTTDIAIENLLAHQFSAVPSYQFTLLR